MVTRDNCKIENMKVKGIPFPEFKEALQKSLDEGDFPETVKDMRLSEFLIFLERLLTEKIELVEEMLKQIE